MTFKKRFVLVNSGHIAKVALSILNAFHWVGRAQNKTR